MLMLRHLDTDDAPRSRAQDGKTVPFIPFVSKF